jgi:succinate dehydrogenase/fumarate reductase flavoprotein subunit
MYRDRPGEDIETDVVVIGAGPGGMAATAAAVAAGARVVLLEASAAVGGNAPWSMGFVTFVDCTMQREQGIEDTVELFVTDAARAAELESSSWAGVIWDRQLTDLFARLSSETYGMLSDRGVRFTRFIERPDRHSRPRLAAVERTEQLVEAFAPELMGSDTDVILHARAEYLIADRGGAVRVRGVHVARDGDAPGFDVVSRRGVVLATGGFQANPELRRRFQPGPLAAGPYAGIGTARGDGHLMGQAVGGDLINMTLIPPQIFMPASLLDDVVAVNLEGQRFHDEPGQFEQRVEALRHQPDATAFYVFDFETRRSKAAAVEQIVEEVIEAPTLAGLGSALGLPDGALERTVGEWNAFLETDASVEPHTGRTVLPAARRPIAVAPFYATRMVGGISLTAGGFATTTTMQVVDLSATPIEGLFAVGDCAGGLLPCIELGGVRLGGALTLGRVAGRAVANGERSAAHIAAPAGAELPSRLGGRVEIVHLNPKAAHAGAPSVTSGA